MTDKQKSKYFSVVDDIKELRSESSNAKEKLFSGGKIIGKSLFNTAKFATTEVLPEYVKQVKAKQKESKSKDE